MHTKDSTSTDLDQVHDLKDDFFKSQRCQVQITPGSDSTGEGGRSEISNKLSLPVSL
jgi:hypothetical protein